MKRIILLATLLLALGTGNRMLAQMQIDCDEAVVARYNYNYGVLDIMEAEKYNYICAESKVAFDFTDVLPEGATLLQLSDLVDRKTNTPVDDTYDELSLCSYYRYNYSRIQAQYRDDRDLYIQLPASSDPKHVYLIVHSYHYISQQATLLMQNNKSNNK